MKDKKGFTLVELLGVIILIGLIALAISSPIVSLINSNSKKIDQAALDLLYTTAEDFMNKDSRTYTKVYGNTYYITIEQLIESGLLEGDFLEAYSEKELSKNSQIKVTVKNKNFKFELLNENIKNIHEVCNDLDINETYNYNGGTYIKGNNANNYVLYNGLIFRIMGVNSNGSVRLIMDEAITSLSYVDNMFNYSGSYVREWLNDYFISRLQYNSIIVDEKWYFKAVSASNKELDDSFVVEDKVGLLSVEELNQSLSSNQSYLIKNNVYGFINISDGMMFVNGSTGNLPLVKNTTGEYYVHPVINVLGSTVVTDGNGTIAAPFVLAEVLTTRTGQTLKEANLFVGDYISIASKLYRVVEKNSDSIKVINYYNTGLNSKYAETDNTFNLYNGIGSVLAGSITNPKFMKKNIFVGDIYTTGSNYKATVFLKKNLVNNVIASVPIMGEMLTSPLYGVEGLTDCYWTLNMNSSATAYQVCKTSIRVVDINSIDINTGVIFTGYIDNKNVIVGGNGTISDPYQI